MNPDNYLICLKVGPGWHPRVVSWPTDCTDCGTKVWRACTSPENALALCVDCAGKRAQADGRLDILGPTPKQLAELHNRLQAPNN